MSMTPAHDAFTLNNRYSRSHSRPSPRSPSPTVIGKLARRTTRRPSHGNNTLLHDVQHHPPAPAARPKAEKKIDWEIPRKTLHSSIGFFVIPLYTHGYSPRPVIIALSGALLAVSATEALRLHNPAFERIYERCLGFLMRDCEKHKINGVVWYILGALLTLLLYPLDVAVVSILILSWADTTASTFGRLWGRHTPALPASLPLLPLPLARRKSLAGFAAASLTAGAIACGFWGWIAPLRGQDALWTWPHGGWLGLGILSVATAFVGGVTEALDLGSLDDNLTLPVISGGVIWGLLRGALSLF